MNNFIMANFMTITMAQIVDAIIPAAGYNKRLESLKITRILPKSMIPIVGKPVLEYIVDFLVSNGINNIYIIVGNKKDTIMNYFGNGEEYGINIHYLIQENPNGIAMALALAKDLIESSFLCVLGDTFLPKQKITKMFETSEHKNAVVVQGVSEELNVDRIKQSCNVILGEHNLILDIIEKPQNPKSNVRGSGIYIFKKDIFDYILETEINSSSGQKEISDTIRLLSVQNKAFYGLLDFRDVNINVADDVLLATQLALKEKLMKHD